MALSRDAYLQTPSGAILAIRDYFGPNQRIIRVKTTLITRQVTMGKQKVKDSRRMTMSPGNRPKNGILGPHAIHAPTANKTTPITIRPLPSTPSEYYFFSKLKAPG